MPITFQNPGNQDFGSPQKGFNLAGYLFDRFEQNRNNKLFKNALGIDGQEGDLSELTPEKISQALLQSALNGGDLSRISPLADALKPQADYNAQERKSKRFLEEFEKNGVLGALNFAPKEAINPLTSGYNDERKALLKGPELSKGEEELQKNEAKLQSDYFDRLQKDAEVANESLEDIRQIRPRFENRRYYLPNFADSNRDEINAFGNRQFERIKNKSAKPLTKDEEVQIRNSQILSSMRGGPDGLKLLDTQETQDRAAVQKYIDAVEVKRLISQIPGNNVITTLFPSLVDDYGKVRTLIEQAADAGTPFTDEQKSNLLAQAFARYKSGSADLIRGPQRTQFDNTSPAAPPKVKDPKPYLDDVDDEMLAVPEPEKKKEAEVAPPTAPAPIVQDQEPNDITLDYLAKQADQNRRRLNTLRGAPARKLQDETYVPKNAYENAVAKVLGKDPSLVEKIINYGPRNVAIPAATRNADLLALGLNAPSNLFDYVTGRSDQDRVAEQVKQRQPLQEKMDAAIAQNPSLAAFDDFDLGDDLLPGYATLPKVPYASDLGKRIYDTLTANRVKPRTAGEKKFEQLGAMIGPTSRQGANFVDLVKSKGLGGALQALDKKEVAKELARNVGGGAADLAAAEVLPDNPFVQIPGRIAANLLGRGAVNKAIQPVQTLKGAAEIARNVGNTSAKMVGIVSGLKGKGVDERLLRVANRFGIQLPLGISTGNKSIQFNENRLKSLGGAAGVYQQFQRRLENQVDNGYQRILNRISKATIKGPTTAADTAQKMIQKVHLDQRQKIDEIYSSSRSALGLNYTLAFYPKNSVEFIQNYQKELDSGIESPGLKQVLSTFQKFMVKSRDEGFKRGNRPELTLGQMVNTVPALNKLKYELTGGYLNILSPFRRAVIKDIEEFAGEAGLKPFLKEWKNARKTYESYATKFKSVSAVRTALETQKPEAIIAAMKVPSQAKALQEAMSTNKAGERAYNVLRKEAVDSIIGPRVQKGERFSIYDFATQSQSYKNREILNQLLGDANYKDLKDLGYVAAKIRDGSEFLANRSDTFNTGFNVVQGMALLNGVKDYMQTGRYSQLAFGALVAGGPFLASKVLTNPEFQKELQKAARKYKDLALKTDKAQLIPAFTKEYGDLITKTVGQLPKSIRDQAKTIPKDSTAQNIAKTTSLDQLRKK